MKLVDSLFDGPLDIVGDIHGEIDALRQLLAGLGYDEAGNHPDGRRLVFVGDLVDRGPDSPAVLRAVRDLVNNGNAQCILGNHELNLLRDDEK
ncbi:MAG: metallophosphoesterase, partial [Gammaproteobacteria bacterium]|nr:metallophosphoesterase [Gammaproteobacteria bacterium]